MKQIRVALVVIAACAALASCSSDSDSSSADSTPTAAATTPDAVDTCAAAKQVETDLAALKQTAVSGDTDAAYDSSVALIESVTTLQQADIPANFQPVLAAFVDQLKKSTKTGTLDIIVMSKYGDKLTAEGNKISKFIVDNCS